MTKTTEYRSFSIYEKGDNCFYSIVFGYLIYRKDIEEVKDYIDFQCNK